MFHPNDWPKVAALLFFVVIAIAALAFIGDCNQQRDWFDHPAYQHNHALTRGDVR